MFLIIVGLILFVLLVVVHELGHLIAAKKNGVVAEEFGLGFPPRAKVLGKKNGTEYTLNWLPIGGFVKLKGENDSAREPGSFGAAPFRIKTLIIVAGVAINWLAAAIIFTVVSWIGMPQLLPNQFQVKSDAKTVRQEVFVGYVEPDSPASNLGLQFGNRINQIGENKIATIQNLQEATKKYANQQVEITYTNEDRQVQTKNVQLRSDPEKGNLGIAPGESTLVRSTWSAPIVGVGTTVQLTAETLKGIGTALLNVFQGNGREASEAVAGPVGIFKTLQSLSKEGFVFVLFLIGVISVSLAVMNSLPIPALDGGRLFVMALFRLIRKPLGKDLEEKIHGTGMAVLLLLAVLITIIDIRR